MNVYGVVTISTELELKTVEDTPVLNFLVSFVEAIGKGDERKTTVHGVACEIWAGAASYLASKCKKGDKLYIDGILRQNRWIDDSGVKHQRNVVRIKTFQVVNTKVDNYD